MASTGGGNGGPINGGPRHWDVGNGPDKHVTGAAPTEAKYIRTDEPDLEPVKPAHSSWAYRFGKLALLFVLVAIVVGLIGATLARFDILDKLTGFRVFMASVPAALIGGAVGLLAVIIGRLSKSGPHWPAIGAIVLSLGLGAVALFTVVLPNSSAPPLHDVTTNVELPPEFSMLVLREDNLVPFQSVAEWRNAHRTGYPNIAPVIIERSPAGVLGSARVLAEQRGWKIANVDPAAGTLEATAFSGYMRFPDDVIVQVTPIADGSTRVDMRSVSRVGESDAGSNAKRIREFLTALAVAN